MKNIRYNIKGNRSIRHKDSLSHFVSHRKAVFFYAKNRALPSGRAREERATHDFPYQPGTRATAGVPGSRTCANSQGHRPALAQRRVFPVPAPAQTRRVTARHPRNGGRSRFPHPRVAEFIILFQSKWQIPRRCPKICTPEQWRFPAVARKI